jgi:hypothetical protein
VLGQKRGGGGGGCDNQNLESDTSPLAPRINNQLTMATGEDATGDGEASKGGKGREGGGGRQAMERDNVPSHRLTVSPPLP